MSIPQISSSSVQDSGENQSQNFGPFPKEVLAQIFQSAVIHQFRETVTLSLVCKQWKEMIGSNNLWKTIFYNLGLPFPSSAMNGLPGSAKQAQRAFAYATSERFLNQVRACHTPHVQKFNIGFNFANYGTIKFLENTYAIGHNEFEMCIFDLNTRDCIKVASPSEILSVCAVQDMIYYSLATGEICAYSLKDSSLVVLHKVLLVDEHANIHGSPVLNHLLANDKWLISISYDSIKLLKRDTGTLVEMRDFTPQMRHFQIDCDRLYWTLFTYDETQALYGWDLNENRSFKYELVTGQDTISNLSVHGSQCSFLQSFSVKSDELSDESLQDSEDEVEKGSIVTVNLVTGERKSHFIQIKGDSENRKLLTLNNIAILAREATDPYADDDSKNDIVEFIDLTNGKIMYAFQEHMVHDSSGLWSLTAFQESMLLVTEDSKIVKFTFPDNKKRPSESEDKNDLKRRRLN